MTKLVLASTSPARLRLLRDAGINPFVIAPNVDEERVAEMAMAGGFISNTADLVLLLAKAKAEAEAKAAAAAKEAQNNLFAKLLGATVSLGSSNRPKLKPR